MSKMIKFNSLKACREAFPNHPTISVISGVGEFKRKELNELVKLLEDKFQDCKFGVAFTKNTFMIGYKRKADKEISEFAKAKIIENERKFVLHY